MAFVAVIDLFTDFSDDGVGVRPGRDVDIVMLHRLDERRGDANALQTSPK